MLVNARIRAKWPLAAGTATSPFNAMADDGMDYVVKRWDIGGPVRASEAICTMIAEGVGVPTPPFRILEDTDGELVFGSQVYGDLAPSSTIMLADGPPSATALGQVSRTVALDLFLGNVDRHLNNFLVRGQSGSMRVLAMDFSHAFLCQWPLPDLPLPPTCKTIGRGRHLRARWGFDASEALDCAGKIDGLPDELADQMINRIPSEWLTAAQAADFVGWWQSPIRHDRAKQIAIGVQNGSLL